MQKLYIWNHMLTNNGSKYWITLTNQEFDVKFLSKVKDAIDFFDGYEGVANVPITKKLDQLDFTQDADGFFAHKNPTKLFQILVGELVKGGYRAPVNHGYRNTHTLVNLYFRPTHKGIQPMAHRMKIYNKSL